MAQNERDCKEFKFKQLIKLQVDKWTSPFQDRVQRLAVAPAFGLAFVASNTGFKALKVVDIIRKDIENPNCANEVITDFPYVADIELGLCPHDLSVSSDNKFLSVCVRRNDMDFALIYTLSSFIQEGPVKASQKIKLSSGDGKLVQLMWNPGIDYAAIFASAMSDGSLCLWEVKDTSFGQQACFPTASAKCLCWSPKGKQLVVGTNDGRLVQYDQNLVEKKVIPGPAALFSGQPFTVVDVVWESTYVFFAAFLLLGSSHEQPHLVHVIAQKGKEPVYTDLEDACFGGGEGRSARYYSALLPQWNMLLLASATSLEAAVLGKSQADEAKWERWILDDAGRAEIPLTENYEEVFPMGFAFDFSSNIPIPIGDNETLPPCPVLLMLGTDGTLICYYMLHSSASSIQRLPTVPVNVKKTLTGEPVVSPVKPAPGLQQSSSQSSSQTKPPEQTTASTSAPLQAPTNPGTALSGLATPRQVEQPLSGNSTLTASLTSSSQVIQPLSGGGSTPATAQSGSSVTQSSIQKLLSVTTAQSTTSTNQPAKQNLFGFSAQTPQSGTSASQTKPTVLFGTPTNQSATPSQGKPPVFGAIPTPFAQSSSEGQTRPATSGMSAPTQKNPAAVSSFAFGNNTMPEQVKKFGTNQATGDTKTTLLSGQGQAPASTKMAAQKLPSAETSAPHVQKTTSKDSVRPVSVSGSSQERPQTLMKSLPKDATQSDGSTKQPTATSPTKRSASREEEGVGQGLTKPGQDHYMKALIEEIQHFQAELNEFKRRGSGLIEAVGSKDEMMEIHKITEEVVSFSENIKQTTQSINNDIHELKTDCLEEFATLEECRAREERNQNPNYRHLLGTRSLDPVSERKIRSIRSQAHYLESGIQDLHTKLDLEWEEWQQSKRNGRTLKCPTTDSIYRTLKDNTRTISNQQMSLDKMFSGMGKPHLGRVKSRQEPLGSPTDTSQWSVSKGYAPRSLLGTSTTPRSRGTPQLTSGTPQMVRGNLQMTNGSPQLTSGSPQTAVVVSPEKQSKLRDLLGSRRVTPIKSTAPGNLTKSRFWASDILDESTPSGKSPGKSTEGAKLKEMSNSSVGVQKSPTMKPADSKPEMKGKLGVSTSASKAPGSKTTPPSSAFTFSKTASEFQGFGSKPTLMSKENTSLISDFSTASKPVPNFSFGKTSTPITGSNTGNTGFSFTGKSDTTFSFNKSSSQQDSATQLATTTTGGFAPSSVGFNFNKTSSDKGQVKTKTSGAGAYTFATKTSDSFAFNKPPDVTKNVSSFNQVSADSGITKLLKLPTDASSDVNPRSKLGSDMSGSFSFPVQATDQGNEPAAKTLTSQKADRKTGFDFTLGSAPVNPDSSSEPMPTKFEVGAKHMQFGSALAEVLAEESTPTPNSTGILGQPKQTAGLFGQSKEGMSSLFTGNPQFGTQKTEKTPKAEDKPTMFTEKTAPEDMASKENEAGGNSSAQTTSETTRTEELMAKKQPAVTFDGKPSKSTTVVNVGDTPKISALTQALGGDIGSVEASQTSQGSGKSQVSGMTSVVPPTQMSEITSTSNVTEKVEKKALLDARSESPSAADQQQNNQPSVTTSGKTPPSEGFKFTSIQSEHQQPTSNVTPGGSQQQQTPSSALHSSQQAPISEGFSFGSAVTSVSTTQNEGKPEPAKTGFSFGSVDSRQPSSTMGFSFGSTTQNSTEKPPGVTTVVASSSQSGTPPVPAVDLTSGQNNNQATTAESTIVSVSSTGVPNSTQQPTDLGFGISQTSVSQQTSAAVTTTGPNVTEKTPVVGSSTSESSSQQTPVSTSVFGFGTAQTGGSQQPPSSSGGFGLGTGFATTQSTSQQATTSSGFSFGTPSTQSGAFGFGQTSTQQATGSGDGMESEGAAQNSNLFGSGGLFGDLGGKPSAENANKNVFGGSFNTASTGSASQGLFGNQSSSGFGGAGFGGPSSQGGSVFANPTAGVSATGFGIGGQQTTPQKSSGFGGAPLFGSGMAAGTASSFGSPPSFGSNPAFGTGATYGSASLFGSASTQSASGFASFANSGAPSFGNLAQQNTPTFGSMAQNTGGGFGGMNTGGGFGGTPNNSQGFGNNSAFGGGQNMSSSSFSNYRS